MLKVSHKQVLNNDIAEIQSLRARLIVMPTVSQKQVLNNAIADILALRARLMRLQAACVEVLDWAEAQDEERRPEWVDRLTLVMEDKQ